MRILALETSGRCGSVALLEGDPSTKLAALRLAIRLPADERTAQSLAPAMRQALVDLEWAPGSLELIAVSQGPGSFTGLRVGVTTAKTLAYAVGAKLIGVSTLAVLAHQSKFTENRVWSVLDAQRGELFAQAYEKGDDISLVTDATEIIAAESWLHELREGDTVTGTVLMKLRDRLPKGVEPVEISLWEPTAPTVGELGWQRFLQGLTDDVWQFVPQYHRRSAAEEKAMSTPIRRN